MGVCGFADLKNYITEILSAENEGNHIAIKGARKLNKPCTLLTLIFDISYSPKGQKIIKLVKVRYQGENKSKPTVTELSWTNKADKEKLNQLLAFVTESADSKDSGSPANK